MFVEVQRRSPELLIVGGGHIAVPLAQMASLCDFAVTVLDDRPSFANQERFPSAAKVIAAPLRETVRDLPMDQDTFIILVTRGHSHDVDCLLEVLDRPVAYIGMIGSQRRVDAVFELLENEMGIDPHKFDRVFAAHRHRHRRAHPGRDRHLHPGRDDQRAARWPGNVDLREAARAGSAATR